MTPHADFPYMCDKPRESGLAKQRKQQKRQFSLYQNTFNLPSISVTAIKSRFWFCPLPRAAIVHTTSDTTLFEILLVCAAVWRMWWSCLPSGKLHTLWNETMSQNSVFSHGPNAVLSMVDNNLDNDLKKRVLATPALARIEIGPTSHTLPGGSLLVTLMRFRYHSWQSGKQGPRSMDISPYRRKFSGLRRTVKSW